MFYHNLSLQYREQCLCHFLITSTRGGLYQDYVWERYSFLELLSIQMSEPNNRPTVRNLILAKSQTSSLFNQRCRLLFIAKCVSLSHAVCGCWSTLPSVSINTRTHTLYLSTVLSFPIFPFRLKARSAIVWLSIEIQISPYSVVLISLVASIQNMISGLWYQDYDIRIMIKMFYRCAACQQTYYCTCQCYKFFCGLQCSRGNIRHEQNLNNC